MEYITLNNQVKMPILGLGTFMLEPDDAQAAVECALVNGYELIDTANAYVNEKAVGRGMKASGKAREEIFLETKLWPCFYESDTAVDETLERLGVDYIDLMILHQPAGDFISGYRKLEAAYKAGKLRAIGVSNFEPAQLVDLIAYNDVAPAVNQVEANLYCQRADDRAWMERYGAAPMAYAPLGQGSRSAMYEEQAVRDAAERHGKTEAQVLLRFLAQLGFCAIPRSTEAAHIRANLDIFDFELDAREMDSLRVLDKREPLIGNPLSPDLVLSSLSW